MSRGSVYYIACTETLRVKIGYTGGCVVSRLKQLQTGSPTVLVIAAVHPGTQNDERELHDKFATQRLRGEWFEMSEEMFEHLALVTWLSAAQAIETGQRVENWVIAGLRSMHESSPLPDHLAVLL